MEIIPIPAFADNYIWLLRVGRAAVVVDPGDAAPVLRYLEQHSLSLTAIMTTHHHGDHVGGNIALLQHYSVPVFGPANEVIPGRTHALQEGDRLTVPGIDLGCEVLDVPGHTAGHIAYFAPDCASYRLFCGDTLFAAGCGRLFEGTAQQMFTSLNKFARLPRQTQVYCAHEYTLANLEFALAIEPNHPALISRYDVEQSKRARSEPTLPSTIGLELATNPFLRCTESGIRERAELYAQRSLSSPLEVFAAIRAWKNVFRA